MCCVWNHTQSYTRQQKIQLAGEINLGPPYGTCTTDIHWLDCTECPTDESLSDECSALVPPFPICCNGNKTVADSCLVGAEKFNPSPIAPPPNEEKAKQCPRFPTVAVTSVEKMQQQKSNKKGNRLIQKGGMKAGFWGKCTQIGKLG